MSDKQPKKSKLSEDTNSEHSTEEPKHEQSPDDDEEGRCLLSSPPAAGAEALTAESGEGTSSRSADLLPRRFKMLSPFKGSKSSSKAKKPDKKSRGSLSSAKKLFRRTFRKSEPIRGSEVKEKSPRKSSDPTQMRTRSKTKSEPATEIKDLGQSFASTSKETTGPGHQKKSKRSFFGYSFSPSSKETATDIECQQETTVKKKEKKSFFGRYSDSTTKETSGPECEKETTTKSKNEPKPKSFFGHSSASTSKEPTIETRIAKKPKKSFFGRSSASKETETQKRPVSNVPSIGAVSVGFFNEGLLPSESSGVPTDSTSLDIKSGSSFSPDAPSSRRPTINKRRRPAKETDEESSFSD